MRIEGRVFRGLLEAIGVWSGTGQLISRSNYCRLEARGDVLGVSFPTQAGWLELEVPTEPGEFSEAVAMDLSLLLKVLKSSTWPRSGEVGCVSLLLSEAELEVLVPNWRKGPKAWEEAAPTRYVFPRVLGGMFWGEEALPAVPELEVSAAVVLEPAVLAAAVEGSARCVASAADRGVLQCVELLCRADEVLGVATDGGVAAVSSEPVALELAEELRVPLPPAALRAALAIWQKAGIEGPITLSVASSEGLAAPAVVLSPPGSSGLRLVLKVPTGHVPVDVLQQAMDQTAVEMGRVEVREALLRQLELAELNPEAKAAWLVWEGDQLRVCSHSYLMDQRCPIQVSDLPSPAGAAPARPASIEVSLETQRVRLALEQLKAAGGRGPIGLAVDSLTRPTRLLLRQSDPATDQVRTVLVMATAGSSYAAYRAKAAELVEAQLEEASKARRRRRYETPEPAETLLPA